MSMPHSLPHARGLCQADTDVDAPANPPNPSRPCADTARVDRAVAAPARPAWRPARGRQAAWRTRAGIVAVRDRTPDRPAPPRHPAGGRWRADITVWTSPNAVRAAAALQPLQARPDHSLAGRRQRHSARPAARGNRGTCALADGQRRPAGDAGTAGRPGPQYRACHCTRWPRNACTGLGRTRRACHACGCLCTAGDRHPRARSLRSMPPWHHHNASCWS